MAQAYVSIGSNLAREANICACLQQLQQDFNKLQYSPVYETEALGFAGNAFYNLVASFETQLSVYELRQYLKQLEAKQGRVRTGEKFSDRSLDIDLLLYDDLVLQSTHNLPHRDILQYAFVLIPLAQLAPQVKHPQNQQTYQQLALQQFATSELSSVHLPCLP